MIANPAATITVTAEERSAVEAALRRRDLPPRLRERLEMVKAAALGQELAGIVRWSGRSPETVRRWLAAFREGGIAALADAPRRGRPPKADAAYLAALEQAIATLPRTLGLSFDVWTSARLSAYLVEQTGTCIAPGWLRVLLERQRFACGRAKHTLDHLQDPDEVAACEETLAAAGEKMAAAPERYELHYEDETHLETNPHLGRVWHRIGTQPTVPAAGTNRRLTVFGSVEALGRGRIEVLQARQDSVGFARYLAALDARHAATGREMILVLDNGPCHVSQATQAALAARAAWLEVIPLARYSPHLNPKEHEWRRLKRDHCGQLAPTLRAFVDAVAAGLRALGGEECAILDEVPQWWVDGHRREPTGRPPGRPKGAKDRHPRQRRPANLPAHT